mmetsp:Transcript_63410/g.169598  ORF Transcript_63410/g.169598 Transcript_63410/m.169598 type:complete len:258 (+) Transcript_63410:55-828(+)
MLARRVLSALAPRAANFQACASAAPACVRSMSLSRVHDVAGGSRSLSNATSPVVVKTSNGPMAGTESYAYDAFTGKNQIKNGGKAEPGDPSRRAFTYFVVGSARFVYASMARLAVIKFVHYMNASADVLALASIEVPIENIPSGGCIVVKWRGKPVFIKKRTEEELQDVANVDWRALRDPQSDKSRYQKEEILVVLGVCTHLGCVPISNAGEFKGGWFCPCHGSHYDASARIRKGPAPLNLEIPPYEFIGETKVKIG